MGMNNYYITIVFNGASIERNDSTWKITGDTEVLYEDIVNVFQKSNVIKSNNKDNMFYINKNELNVYCSNANQVCGIYIKGEFSSMKRASKKIYLLIRNISLLFEFDLYINDTVCKVFNGLDLCNNIKSVYAEKYNIYQHSRRKFKRLFK
ncbi:MAG: hypothetical protein HDT25_05790 [Ruminococcus sp.]|nr:hypothetical protein [Ruminococcus sp.]